MKMNQKVKDLWLDALLSGDYKQGEMVLKDEFRSDETKHCCLGVLCEVRGKALKKKVFGKEVDLDDSYLSDKISKWAGLDRPTQEKLAVFNDVGKSFKWIAAYIKRYL